MHALSLQATEEANSNKDPNTVLSALHRKYELELLRSDIFLNYHSEVYISKSSLFHLAHLELRLLGIGVSSVVKINALAF